MSEIMKYIQLYTEIWAPLVKKPFTINILLLFPNIFIVKGFLPKCLHTTGQYVDYWRWNNYEQLTTPKQFSKTFQQILKEHVEKGSG